MTETTKVSIVGPGRMGIGIATALLSCPRGFTVHLVDLKERKRDAVHSALNQAKAQVAGNLSLLQGLGHLTENPNMALERLSLSAGLDNDFFRSELIFEALPEKPELKQAFLKEIEPHISKNVIIASATSTINLQTFWDVAETPERIVIAHWLNPAFIVPLVEVSTGEKTAPWARDRIKELLEKAGKIPVMIKDSPGFIVPRIQVAAMNEAVRIIEEGVASPEDVDTAVKAGFGFRLAVLGLIEFLDLGGLDILYHASHFLFDKFRLDQYRPLQSIIEKMEKGEIGPKSGKGFYDYAEMDTEVMFNRKYKGFLELLSLVRDSKTLSFRGGVRE